MGSNTSNLYNLKNGANKLAEINVTKSMIDTMLSNLALMDLNTKFQYNLSLNAFEGWNGTSWDIIGSGQMLGTADTKAVWYAEQNTNENLTLGTALAPLNGFSIDSLTIEDGGSLTISDGSVYKVL